MATSRKQSFLEGTPMTNVPQLTAHPVDLGNGVKASMIVANPGWRWTEHVKPIVGGDFCQKDHVGHCLSGHMRVQNGDHVIDVGPGVAYVLAPGHDAWVVGNEPCVMYEFDSSTVATFGKTN